MIGYQAGLQVLSTCCNLKYANQYFGENLEINIANRNLTPKDGFIDVLDAPGIGLDVDEDHLNKCIEIYKENGEFSAFEIIDKNYLPIFPKF